MKLLDIIKGWFLSDEKDNLEHFDIQKIERLINKIKTEPFLTFMQTQIEELLQNISVSSKNNKGTERKFITIDGVSGSGKTNLVYEYLKDFLLSTGVIKQNQVLIDKIASHDLTSIGVRD